MKVARKGQREAVNIPPDQADFIRRRVAVLLQPDRSIIDLICDGYIQGMSDAVNMPKETRS